MKRKVGELFNKPIVQGNENVLSSNEILVEQKGNTFSLKERVNGEVKEVSGSSTGGMLFFGDFGSASVYMAELALMGQVGKFKDGNISPIGMYVSTKGIQDFPNDIIAFGIHPMDLSSFGLDFSAEGIRKMVENLEILYQTKIREITEEEFYNINA